MQFNGKVAVVTGAGNGLGRIHALMLASKGCKVVVNDLGGSVTGGIVLEANKKFYNDMALQESTAPADKVVAEIRNLGGIAVANYDSVVNGDRIVQTAIDSYGRIDIVICNAGITIPCEFIDYTDEIWDKLISVHLKGTYKVVHAAWPHFIKQKYGRIVTTGSPAGLWGMQGQAAYSAAKMAMIGLSKTWAAEGRKTNITANVICPYAATRMTGIGDDNEEKRTIRNPAYIAAIVTYLAHQSSKNTSGKVFECADGWYGRVETVRANGVKLPLTTTPKDNDLAEQVRDNFAAIEDWRADGNEVFRPGNFSISTKLRNKKKKSSFKLMSTSNNQLLHDWLLPIDLLEPTLDPFRRIVDPHHHLWIPTNPLVKNIPSSLKFQTAYLAADLTKDINNSGHNVTQTVFIEACSFYNKVPNNNNNNNKNTNPSLGETCHVQKIHDEHQSSKTIIAAGIVGFIDLSLDTTIVKQAIEAHIKAVPNLKGLRFANSYAPNVAAPHNLLTDLHPQSLLHNTTLLNQCILTSPLVRQNIQLLASYGLSLDIWSHHNHLPQVIDTIQAIPECLFIVDHIGGLLRHKGKWKEKKVQQDSEKEWHRDIIKLAALKNVVIKVGGVGMSSMGFGWSRAVSPPTSLEVANVCYPFFEHVIRSFGAERCMFESNFPVCKTSFSYKVYWNACKRIANRMNLTEQEKNYLFARTAEKVYRLNITANNNSTLKITHSLKDGQTGQMNYLSANPFEFRHIIQSQEKPPPSQIVQGELLMPTRRQPGFEHVPVPCVVGMHGSWGWGIHHVQHLENLRRNGFATFTCDSFVSRGVERTSERQLACTMANLQYDSYAALQLLATHPGIDSNRIGCVGWSLGEINWCFIF